MVGVPLITPVAVASVRPAGSPEAAKEVGELLAVTWKLNTLPSVAEAEVALEIAGTPTGAFTVSATGTDVTVALAPLVTTTV